MLTFNLLDMKILIIDENGVKEFVIAKSESKLQKEEKLISQEKKKESTIENSSKEKLGLYSIADLVLAFKTSRPNIYSWIRKGYLKQISIGGRKYFKREDIEKMLEEKTEK